MIHSQVGHFKILVKPSGPIFLTILTRLSVKQSIPIQFVHLTKPEGFTLLNKRTPKVIVLNIATFWLKQVSARKVPQ